MLRNLIAPLAGAALAGALIGLAEASWLASAGVPELWLFPYAIVLYTLLAVPLGVAGLAGISVARRWLEISQERAFCLGGVAALAPLSTAILIYAVNKEVYAEQGIPPFGKVAILAVVFAISTVALTAGPAILRGPLQRLLAPLGAPVVVGALAVVGCVVALAAPAADPRQSWGGGAAVPAPLADKPDILVIMVDTLRADHLGAYGGHVKTPALDALAADSVVFEHAFANASWTRAATASLFTSRVPSGHGTATKAARLPDEAVTFAEALHQGGVTTGALVNNINVTQTFNFQQGFDTFVYESPEYRFAATESVFGLSLYKVVHKLAEKVLGKHKTVERFYQPADVVLGDAQRFLAATKGSRVALFVHLMEPHDPYFEHPSLEGTGGADYNGVGYARAERERPAVDEAPKLHRLYDGEVAFLDRQVAPFFDQLRRDGRYDDMMIIVTADHGEEFAEHGGFWHGTTLYTEQVHIPMIVKLPRRELAGTRVPWQVRAIDLAPTLTAAEGLAPDKSWAGRDLIADVRTWKAKPEGLVASFERPVISEEDFEGNQLSALRKGGFHWITANAGNPRGLAETELYDVEVDVPESHNLSGTSAAIRGQYPADIAKAWGAEMTAAIAAAKVGAVKSDNASMSDAERQNLCALGYLQCDGATAPP
jgi:arylsulfatase A-like enzyme